MNSYLADRKVIVFPFVQRPDGDETIIANAANTSFLALPSSAVDILTWLAQKKTVSEAQALYEQKYGEVPDMEDFLSLLESEGFVAPDVEEVLDAAETPQLSTPVVNVPQANSMRYHFESISQDFARRFFSRPILLCCAFLICLSLVLTLFDPAIIPPPQVLVFKQDLTLMSIGLYLFIFATVFLHEMAHLLAARAAGVPARMGISHRLWILVAQTDMTGIWLLPRRQRYLPVLAGSLLDAVCAALLMVLLFLQHQGWIIMAAIPLLLCRVALFTYLFRLLWQCYLFVQTDFYYLLAIVFNCKNLMGDTETLLLNLCSRFLPFIQRADQSDIPLHEMRFIRVYAYIWIIGRIAAFLSLFLITIPILAGYFLEIGAFLLRGQLPRSLALADVVGWAILIVMPFILQIAGFALWMRSLYLRRRSKNVRLAR